MQEEQQGFAALAARPYADVLVVGGGINGLATLRDLAMQGVDVALAERSDFVSGASAASSHMIHGGIRYLENGEFRLVHEAVTERNALLRIAPHYVRPLQTTIPIFSTFSGVLTAPLRFLRHGGGEHRERGAALIKIGLVIYDSFSRGGGRVARHEFHGRRRSLQQLPRLNPGVKYTATYWDASLHDPERLAIDVLRDGLAAGGDRARAANYTAAVGVDDGRILLRDQRTGREVPFAASVVVNATGPWTDVTNLVCGEPTDHMGGTKGSHIVLDHPELLAATGGRELFFEHKDGRIVLIYPLKGRVLVGTTDIEHDMRDPIVCTEAEVDYFIDLVGQVLPGITVDRDRIVYRFSGVRPLPGHGELAPGFVSRDYRIETAPLAGRTDATVLSLVGGKWTTFRA
ncbi:MAG: glycerol-3-phosphate dehydrogenase/oxidase, partial [Microbacterium sp.]